jgi:alcohol dehydrogenase class IV
MTAAARADRATAPAGARGFRHLTPAFRVFAGAHALSALRHEVERAESSRLVLMYGRSIGRNAAVTDRIAEALGYRVAGSFAGVVEHSPTTAVEAACAELARLGADGIVAIGGGSAIVTARAAAILHAESAEVHSLCTRRRPDGSLISPRLLEPKLPIWLVPSTPTTAYARAGSAVRDAATGERLALFDPKTRAAGLFFDPVVVASAPPSMVQAAAVNAFNMSVEALLANAVDPLADAQLLHALRLLTEHLVRLGDEPTDEAVRQQLMVGALLAGQGSEVVGGGLAQALAHAAGPLSSVQNGIVEAILLPHAIRFNAPEVGERLPLLADAVGAGGTISVETGDAVANAVAAFLSSLGVPARLRDVGVAQQALTGIAAHTRDDWTLTRVPRQPISHTDLHNLLQQAW